MSLPTLLGAAAQRSTDSERDSCKPLLLGYVDVPFVAEKGGPDRWGGESCVEGFGGCAKIEDGGVGEVREEVFCEDVERQGFETCFC